MYIIEREQIINKKLEDIFPFFTEAENLAIITPSWLKFKIRSKSTKYMQLGSEFNYTIKFFGLPMFWKTKITKYEPTYLFVDEQLRGPYKKWIHEHSYTDKGDKTIIHDKVEYDLYGGIFKSVIHQLFVKRSVQKIFEYRKTILGEYFERN